MHDATSESNWDSLNLHTYARSQGIFVVSAHEETINETLSANWPIHCHQFLVDRTWRQMHNRKFRFQIVLSAIAAVGAMAASLVAAGQTTDRPWMNPNLSPEDRADLVLKQLTLEEK